MAITLTNTLSGKRETLVPLVGGQVRMYVCGPTVYGFTHVGNARPAVFFDVVRRFLEWSGFQVTYVSNFTDVDDKIIQRAHTEKSRSEAISEKYTAEYLTDMAALGVRPPSHAPKVTDHIQDIVEFIGDLVEKGVAYVTADGEVLYSVRKFTDYGKLSKKKLDDLIAGARVETSEKKNDPLDFALWKPQKAPDEPAWDSPWGKGRPGWHIECSAMARHFLGDTFDIHGGGIDLLHPHHENEIAQSEALTGQTFARYWMHNNLLTIASEKMSKSQGNIFLNRDFIRKHTGEVLKFLLLSGHYRSPIDFSEQHIRECQAGLHRIYSALERSLHYLKGNVPGDPKPASGEAKQLATLGAEFPSVWRSAMEDDFNTAKVIAAVFDYVRAINACLGAKGFRPSLGTHTLVQQFIDAMCDLSHVLNLFAESPGEYLGQLRGTVLEERGLTEPEILSALSERKAARGRKDFATADTIRNDLLKKGIEIRDQGDASIWDVIF